MGKIQELLDSLASEAALEEITAALKKLRPAVSQEGPLNFVRQIASAAAETGPPICSSGAVAPAAG